MSCPAVIKVVSPGPPGPTGPTGPAGVGAAWQQGSGVPGAGVGSNGDFYLNTANGDIYGPKTAGAWGAVIFNIAQGQQGPAGPAGAAGATGAAGAAGRTVLSGSGAPGAGVGANGDFFIDTTNWVIYGPKAGGAWPGGASLIGPTGATGSQGPTGPTGLAGVVTLAPSVTDILNLVGQELSADDPGGDRLLFWDDSESKATHLSVGPGIVFDGTTLRVEEWLWVACSDETTALTTGAAKITFRMPFAATLLSVRASLNTAPAGANLVVDVNEGGLSVLSTKLSIDATERTSTTAATPAVISDSALADDAEITIDIDQIGSSTAGAGLKVGLYVRRV